MSLFWFSVTTNNFLYPRFVTKILPAIMANQEHVELLKQSIEVWNKWRRDNPSINPDLSGLNLSGINLSRRDLSTVNLFDCNLSGANLTKANLSEANLTSTNISGANLTGSFLLSTNFHYTLIEDTDFSYVGMSGVQFSSVNLGTAQGLDTITHLGRSSIDIDTFILSKNNIPQVFLRGCGVPDEITIGFRDYFTNPIEFYSCFISYSREDKAFARQLHDFLQGRGIRCWLDEHQILPGHDIYDEVDRGMKMWDKVLLCASKNSLTSWWVDNEIGKAFNKEQGIMKSRGKKVLAIIPLDLDGYLFNGWESGKADEVRSRLAADFTDWETDNQKMQQQLERVVKALRTDGGREAPPSSLL